MDNSKKKVMFIAIAVVLVVLIIVTIVALATKGGKDDLSKDLNVNFEDGTAITVKNIKDGWSSTKNITVTNESNDTIVYTLVWAKASNTFKVQSDLLYSIESKGDGASTLGTSQIPVAASPIFKTVTIEKGKTHEYEFKVWYDKSNEKTDESDSAFNGTLQVKVVEDE